MALRTKQVVKNNSESTVTPGSGNVFADLGIPDAEEALVKARLAQRIDAIIERNGLTQIQAAAVLGIDLPKISALRRGRLTGFSTDRLLRFLTALDQDVQIVVRQKPKKARRHARLSVVAA